jgi:hypothetical protein
MRASRRPRRRSVHSFWRVVPCGLLPRFTLCRVPDIKQICHREFGSATARRFPTRSRSGALQPVVTTVGIGAAYIESERALLLVSSLAALLFWTIEVYWKTNQQAFGDRMWQIEHALALDQATGLKPFQIATTWGAERRKSR